MSELLKDPQSFIYAILGGFIPALIWLWFWLKQEDKENPEPIGMIVISFVAGAIVVIFAILLQKYTLNLFTDSKTQIIIWAAIEEILKLLAVVIVVFGTGVIDEPIDYPIYFITCALGFAALENILYLVKITNMDGSIVGMLTGNLRFLGSTLLHSVASSAIGSALGLSFYLKKGKTFYLLIGLSMAILLHSVFNFFIMKGSGEKIITVFGFLWVIVIINILIFEKLRRMGQTINKITS
jgi:RsiW-degrading membrane proteinase PrsW (M82 family)